MTAPIPGTVTDRRFFAGPYTYHDGLFVFQNLRTSDQAEILARREAEPVLLAADFGRAVESGLTLVHYLVRRWPLGRPILIFGISLTGPGVAEANLFATDEFPLVAVPFARFLTRNVMPQLAELGWLRRVVAYCADRPETVRYLRHCGARHEAALAGFGRWSETFHQFAWVRAEIAQEASDGRRTEAA